MNLLPIAQYLEDNHLGIQAKTIFINQIPVECPNGILLRNKLQGTPVNYELPGYYKTTFQLVVRSNDYTLGNQSVNDVVAALTLQEVNIDTMHIKFMRPKTLPVVFPISKGNLLEFALDMEIVFILPL